MILDLAHIKQPYSGEYEEIIFDFHSGRGSAEWTWIKFEEEIETWCGEFRGKYRGAVLSKTKGVAVILTSDCLYVLDSSTREVVDYRQQPIWKEITCTPCGDILLNDGYGLELEKFDGKRINDAEIIVLPINADGLTFVGYDDNYLVMKCDEFCNWSNHVTLLLDYRTMEVIVKQYKPVKETYYLNQNEVPTIPVPHDCVIKAVRLEENNIVFEFENDISYHDSIKSIRPDAKSLVATFHFLNDKSDITMFVRRKANRLLHKPGVYREIEDTKFETSFHRLTGQNLTYLYHNVGYCSMIIHLWATESVVLDLTIDYAEFEWIE